MKSLIKDFDIFYISYDEPKKEQFWDDIKTKIPMAKRVDGIKGFDSAHKECARNSDTDYLVTVDGDCIIDPSFLDLEIELYENAVYSWSTKNHINGLIYGNGSLKIWPKKVILEMKTHENSENEKSKIDFCWDIEYIQKNEVYSTTYPNGSPYQAFRAGFREGVKMSLEQGFKVNPERLSEELYYKNYQRLLIWCNVGKDVENGTWAIYGTRMGVYKTYLTDWDFVNIRDYDWLKEYWHNEILPQFDNAMFRSIAIDEEVKRVGNILHDKLGMSVGELDSKASKFFKEVYINPPRQETDG